MWAVAGQQRKETSGQIKSGLVAHSPRSPTALEKLRSLENRIRLLMEYSPCGNDGSSAARTVLEDDLAASALSHIAIYSSQIARRLLMRLKDKLRSLREVEGRLRGLNRALTQGELVRFLTEEQGESISQSYLSQIESGSRPHLTNTSRGLLARFFKVHPGYLVDDPEGYHPELLSDLRHEVTADTKLDAWLEGGAERFGGDPELCAALGAIARHPESRQCLLLLESLLEAPALADQLFQLLRPEGLAAAGPDGYAQGVSDVAARPRIRFEGASR